MARKNGRGLPDRFWNLDEWKNVFQAQHRFANALLRNVEAEVAFKVLRANTWVLSLNNKKFEDLVLAEQRRLDVELKKNMNTPLPASTVVPAPVQPQPRPIKKEGNSLRSRLKDI